MTVDLQNLIDNLQLDKKLLAKVLFPDAIHPDMALSRLLSKRSKMDEQQLFALATFCGTSVDSLYASQQHWKMNVQNNLIRFTQGPYTALYDPSSGITRILHLEKQIALHTISHSMLPLTEYLQSIHTIITNQLTQES